jgi:FkbM family methyltransferase
LIAQLVRRINKLNPTTYGHHRLARLPRRLNAEAMDGIYEVHDGVVMELSMKDYVEWAIYYNAFEPCCTRIVRHHLYPGSVFLDIGANVGYYSLMASRRVMPGGRIFAFEPNPRTAEKFRRNVALSGAAGIELFNVALSDHEGMVELYCPAEESHGLTSMRSQGWSDPDRFEVQGRTLDEALPRDLDRLDFVKIDVEGAERLVFEGAGATISRFRPTILLELNESASRAFGYDSLDVVDVLLSYNPGYRIQYIDFHRPHRVDPGGLRRDCLRNGNLLLS